MWSDEINLHPRNTLPLRSTRVENIILWGCFFIFSLHGVQDNRSGNKEWTQHWIMRFWGEKKHNFIWRLKCIYDEDYRPNPILGGTTCTICYSQIPYIYMGIDSTHGVVLTCRLCFSLCVRGGRGVHGRLHHHRGRHRGRTLQDWENSGRPGQEGVRAQIHVSGFSYLN